MHLGCSGGHRRDRTPRAAGPLQRHSNYDAGEASRGRRHGCRRLAPRRVRGGAGFDGVKISTTPPSAAQAYPPHFQAMGDHADGCGVRLRLRKSAPATCSLQPAASGRAAGCASVPAGQGSFRAALRRSAPADSCSVRPAAAAIAEGRHAANVEQSAPAAAAVAGGATGGSSACAGTSVAVVFSERRDDRRALRASPLAGGPQAARGWSRRHKVHAGARPALAAVQAACPRGRCGRACFPPAAGGGGPG